MTPPESNTPTPVDPEITNVLRMNASSSNTWKTVSFVLGLILVGGTVIGVVGRAFYVTRTEYTEKSMHDSLEQSSLTDAVKSIKESLHDQSMAFRELQSTVNDLKLDVFKGRREK